MPQRIIIVSNRLPVTIERNEDELTMTPSPGGLATGLSSIYEEGDNVWIGWPGLHEISDTEKEAVEGQLSNNHMAPVFLTKDDVQLFYEGFSNRTIWPLFHYFPEFARYDGDLWEAYQRVNQFFCDAILKAAGPEDIIWIHDYQLLLLPQMVREKLPNATIGFFQHIPFPSFEIFRLLPWRSQLLEGVLGSDLIGFHTYDDMRHFLSSVNRVRGYGSTMGQIRIHNRLVAVDSFPMGIDYEKFSTAPKKLETQEKAKRYENMLQAQKVIVSIDRLDYSKGIKQRLNAFDSFLTKHPEYIGKVSLVLVVVPSRVKVDQYQQLKEEIDTLVGRLDGKYSRMDWVPIHYFYRSFPFADLSAIYSRADVALITPLRDGMNLVCKEFVATKTDKQGVLILSEMAGAAKELSEAILINPNDENQIVSAIHQALTMPEEEQSSRIEDMQAKLKRYNIHRWVEVFMEQLDKVKEKQKDMTMKLLNEKRADRLKTKYLKANKRMLFLDYDGTLKPFVENPKKAYPDKELLELLEQLANDPKNQVVIISGRDKVTLSDWMGHLKLDIIAEHGVWLRRYGKDWATIEVLEFDWKEQIMQILESYVDRTPGAFIENKDYSVVWHFRKADPDFGELRTRELLSNLNYLIANMNLQIMEGNKVIEIKSREVNKGKAAKKWLSEAKPDFILAVGDDVTDEDTFQAMPEEAFTLKVGLTSSAAKYNIRSAAEVRQLLSSLLDR